jgi:hypothetical protein
MLHNHSATPDVIHQTQFALDVKAKTLPLYEKIFDIEYPLPKLDTLVVSRIIHIRYFWLTGGFQASDFDAG